MLNIEIKFQELSNERITIISDNAIFVDEVKININLDNIIPKYDNIFDIACKKNVKIKGSHMSRDYIESLIPKAYDDYLQYLRMYERLRGLWSNALSKSKESSTMPMEALKLTISRYHSKTTYLGEILHIYSELTNITRKLEALTDKHPYLGYTNLGQ